MTPDGAGMASLVVAGLLALTGGCAPRVEIPPPEARGEATPAVPTADSLVADSTLGRVAVVGPDPVTWVVLVEASGAQLRLDGAATDLLRALTGAEVLVRGMRGRSALRVETFVVRRVNGAEVDDGIVLTSPVGVSLRLESGAERAVADAPPGLRALSGARVWVSRPVRGVTPSYGVIERQR